MTDEFFKALFVIGNNKRQSKELTEAMDQLKTEFKKSVEEMQKFEKIDNSFANCFKILVIKTF